MNEPISQSPLETLETPPRLNILHLTPFYHPATHYGGPIVQLQSLCRHLHQKGHSIKILTSNLGTPASWATNQWIPLENQVQAYYLQCPPVTRFPPHLAPGLTRVFKETLKGIDLVHLSLSFTHGNLVASRWCSRFKIPYIYTPRGCLCPTRLKIKQWQKALFLRFFERRVIRHASAIHVLTEAEKHQVMVQGGSEDKIHVIPNGIDLEEIPQLQGSTFRQRHRIGKDQPIILFLSRLHPVKGTSLLIPTLHRLLRKHPHTVMVIAGPDDGVQRHLFKQAKTMNLMNSLRFTGHLHDRDKWETLRDSNLFLLPSFSEGLPNAVLEAAAMGLPSVITPQCQVPQVDQYKAGRIVTPDAKSLAQALDELLASPQLRLNMGKNARRMVNDCFSMSTTIIAKIGAMYQWITQKQSK